MTTASLSKQAIGGLGAETSDGVVLDRYEALRPAEDADDATVAALACPEGFSAFVARNAATHSRLGVCLPRNLAPGTHRSEVVYSITRHELRLTNNERDLDLVHHWWQGRELLDVTVSSEGVELAGEITLDRLATPASFTGGTDPEKVRFVGRAKLVLK